MKKWAFYSKWILRLGIVIAGIYDIAISNYVGLAGGIGVLAASFLVDFVNTKKRIFDYEVIASLSIFCIFAHVMGVMFDFYDFLNWWDLLMHLFSGIVLAFVGNSILNRFQKREYVHIFIRIVFVIGVACIGGVLWEIFEYSADNLLGLDTQKFAATGLNDTMQDFITDFLGAIIYALFLPKMYKNKNHNN